MKALYVPTWESGMLTSGLSTPRWLVLLSGFHKDLVSPTGSTCCLTLQDLGVACLPMIIFSWRVQITMWTLTDSPQGMNWVSITKCGGLRVSHFLCDPYVHRLVKPDRDGCGRDDRFLQRPIVRLQLPLDSQGMQIPPKPLCQKISLISSCTWSHIPHPNRVNHRSCEILPKSRCTDIPTFSNGALPLVPKSTYSLSCSHGPSFPLE
jgi:hypothetical protein